MATLGRMERPQKGGGEEEVSKTKEGKRNRLGFDT
jgi:hypothetical protein